MQKRFTDIFINRPVFATCLSFLVFLVGLVCYFTMEVRQYPKVEFPLINILTTYPGAPAEVMEGFVTTPIEQAISTADGIDYITSQSTQGASNVNVYMKLGSRASDSMTDIANKVSSVRGQLPKEIDDPVISKEDAASLPFLFFNVSSTTLNPQDLTDYLIRVLQPQMQEISGVSSVDILGGREYAMRIWLDPNLMAARDVTAVDVYNAINQYNVTAPAGTLNSDYQQINLYSSTDLKTADQFNNILLRNENGQLVQMKDVGQAQLGVQNTDFSLFINDKESIFLVVNPKSDANPLTLQKSIMGLLDRLRPHFPKGVSVNTFYDSTKFIIASIKEVKHTLFEACIFVFLVIFFMLGSVRAVIIPLVTIPLSMFGACIIMTAMQFSINTITLLAFVLAIGLVVDDAIVVMENFHRHLEHGLTPKQAAIIGAREISFAVIAMTLTLAAVYAPIGFMGGLTGKLFTEFAFTLAGAVLVSGFIALTLSPMMCSKMYRLNENLHGGLVGYIDTIFSKVRDGYRKSVRLVIRYRYIIVILALVVYASCYLLLKGLQQELAPEEDQGALFSIAYAPAAANLDYTQAQTKQITTIFKKMIPEAEGYFVVNGYPGGVNSALAIVVLKDWEKRHRTAMEIRNSLLFPLWGIPGVKAFPALPPSLPGASGYIPVEFVLSTSNDYASLEQEANQFLVELEKSGEVTNVDSDLKIDAPQVNIEIDRNKAADLGIPMNDISISLNTFLSKPKVTYFNMNGLSYEVIPRLYRNFRDIPNALNNLNVRTKTGELVPLSDLVTLTNEVVPESLNHFQQLRSATITANLMPGVSLGTALDHLEKLSRKVLPKGVQIDYSGASRQYMQTSGTMGKLFIFALIFIYLLLAAQFESFRDPFIVMLTVPLAMAGAFIGLYLCHGTLNIYTEIGLVTLIGLITKNGILIVEFANQQQERGVAFHRAIIEAATLRLRPILMTTFAMILGALPLALASGAGAVSRQQMGFVIVFGMSFGTLLTLFVVPSAYYLMATRIKSEHIREVEEAELERVARQVEEETPHK
jgi:multidrug efflux pump